MKIKKLLLVGVVSLVGVSSVCAQGTVNFLNRITGTLDVPIYLDRVGVGGTLLSGANFLATLYWSATQNGSFAPIVEPPSAFRTGAGAGYWNAGADSTRVVGVLANNPVWLQVRAWDSTSGATYDIAKAAGGLWGDSNVFQVTTGGGILAPANMTGLQSFALVPEPSTLALGILGAVALMFRRRN